MAFAGSTNTTIHGSSFSDIHRDQNIYFVNGNMSIHDSEAGIFTLKGASNLSATHDSFERSPPPKCHPGTRQTALRGIDGWMGDMQKKIDTVLTEWSSQPSATGIVREGRFLWLHGPAGAGKSALAQTVSEKYAESQKLVGTFFFSRETPGRDAVNSLFPTIAYQMAIRIPGMRSSIGSAVKLDPSIFEKSLEAQVKHLIILPFCSVLSLAKSRPPDPPFLVVVDGLDECSPDSSQGDILSLFTDLLYLYHLPLCFLVVSRPEPHIKDKFGSHVFRSHKSVRELLLYGEHDSGEARNDTRVFLRAEFDRICESAAHRGFMEFVSRPWPSQDIVERLVDRSGGYFIYAASVTRFVDKEFNPVEGLNIILDATWASPFAKLDRCYHQILSDCPNRDRLIAILGAIFTIASISESNWLLDLQLGTVRSTLHGMHSLFRVGDKIECFHASLQDFLVNKDRAGPFFIDPEKHHGDMAHNLLRIVDRWTAASTSINERLLCLTWPFHASRASNSSDIISKIKAIDELWASVLDSLYQPHYPPENTIHMLAPWRACSRLGPSNDLVARLLLSQILAGSWGGGCEHPRVRQADGYHGYSGFESFMDDPTRSGDVFTTRVVCHTRLALSCMQLLGHLRTFRGMHPKASLESYIPTDTSKVPLIDHGAFRWHDIFITEYRLSQDPFSPNQVLPQYSKRCWAKHLSMSSPGDKAILFCLRANGRTLLNRVPSCESPVTGVKYLFRRVTHRHNDGGIDPSPDVHERNFANAKLVVQWLKKMNEPPSDLLLEWTPCWRCKKFHAADDRPLSSREHPIWHNLIEISTTIAEAWVEPIQHPIHADTAQSINSHEMLASIRSKDNEALGWTGRMRRLITRR
ncbi:hypothetical protein FPV67DRAFT_764118 [Lyophyllum atratum]|nr:hypothetical protein FPV67DRAFT_764118 [Lyophyllum atratum]